MKTIKSRSGSVAAAFMSILLAVVLATAGCTQRVVPVDGGPQITMMVKTNVTSSGDYNAPLTQYDAAPFV